MKYNFVHLNTSITYLKSLYWYRYQFTNANRLRNATDLRVVYKTKSFLVVDKPFDMILYDFSKYKSENLLDMIKEKFPLYYDTRVRGGYRVMHRLDSITSGCFCVPLHKYAEAHAIEAQKNGNMKKSYLALCYGHVDEVKRSKEYFEIDAYIGDDANNLGHLVSVYNNENGNVDKECLKPRRAITRAKVLELGTYKGKKCTKMLIELVTGRRHQIRVHMKHIGHPVVGDVAYGIGDFDTYRTMLHCHKIEMKLKDNKKSFIAIADDPFKNEIDEFWKPETIINKI